MLTHEAVAASARTTSDAARRDGRRPLAGLPPARPRRRSDGRRAGDCLRARRDGASRRFDPDGGQRVGATPRVARRHGAATDRPGELPHGRARSAWRHRRRCPPNIVSDVRDDRDGQRGRDTTAGRSTASRSWSTSARRVASRPDVAARHRDGIEPNRDGWSPPATSALARRRPVGRRRPRRPDHHRWRERVARLVEASSARHQAVAESGVAGIPDEEWGQVVVAVVVPRSSACSLRSGRTSNGRCPHTAFLAGS